MQSWKQLLTRRLLVAVAALLSLPDSQPMNSPNPRMQPHPRRPQRRWMTTV